MAVIETFHKGHYRSLHAIYVKNVRLLEQSSAMAVRLQGFRVPPSTFEPTSVVPHAHLAAAAADAWLEILEAVRNQKLYSELEDHVNTL